MDELPRLRDEDSALGEALRDANDLGPSNAERDKVAAGLAAILGPPPGGLPPASGGEAATSGAAATTGSALIKWAVAACFVGGVVWWGVEASPPSQVASADPQESIVAPERPADMVPMGAAPSSADPVGINPVETSAAATRAAETSAAGVEVLAALRLEPAVDESVPAREARRPRESSRARPRSASPAEGARAAAAIGTSESAAETETDIVDTPQVVEGPSELSLLAEARRVLRGSPAQTLRLTNQHRARFDGGALVEEREVLAIEALVRLSRHSQASERADRFRARFPRSIHATRISAVLAP